MNAIEIAINTVGGQKAMANAIGAKPARVGMWKQRGQAPADMCRAIAKACGYAVTEHDLRPDIFGPPTESQAA